MSGCYTAVVDSVTYSIVLGALLSNFPFTALLLPCDETLHMHHCLRFHFWMLCRMTSKIPQQCEDHTQGCEEWTRNQRTWFSVLVLTMTSVWPWVSHLTSSNDGFLFSKWG